jgi:predicted RNase H-like HicB family nuclease
MPCCFYPALILKDSESEYGVVFPDLPACVTAGETVQEAALDAAQALARHILGLAEDKAEIPPPSAPDAALPEWLDEHDARTIVARVLVPVEVPGRSLRITIAIDEALLARIDEAASCAGGSRSDFIAEAARARLGQRTLAEATLQAVRAGMAQARALKMFLEQHEREGQECAGESAARMRLDRVVDAFGSLQRDMLAPAAAAARPEADAVRFHALVA